MEIDIILFKIMRKDRILLYMDVTNYGVQNL
jgi:hypothetical protein